LQYAATALPQSRILLPGDSLVTECNLSYSGAYSGYFAIKVGVRVEVAFGGCLDDEQGFDCKLSM
jgi:hypothetical protein